MEIKKAMAETSLVPPENTDDAAQLAILDELRRYLFVGGMPERVKTWRDSGSMVCTFEIQSEIIESLRDDFSKYSPRVDPSCDPSGVPLGASSNPKKFKASFLDIGLMQRLCRVPVELELQQDNLLSMYRGKLAEQFVAQELLAWHGPELYYWARDARGSSAEVDFLMSCDGKVYPVEVKSGAGGSLKSLHMMLGNIPDAPRV